MTSCLLSIALILTPAPIAPTHAFAGSDGFRVGATAMSLPAPAGPANPEARWTTTSLALTVVTTDSPPAPTTSTADDVEPPPTPEPNPIDRALNELTQLGATSYELRVFGCLAWYESRDDPHAVSPTNDYGLFQPNGIHAWRWAGRDIFDPVVNADVAWDIYRESGFRPWSTHSLCGV